jgi:hypothetical protein
MSASAAEGISLRNVRQVHIMEPYWQRVRIQQVIGRARRAHSHSTLPASERNVHVFLYVATLNEALAAKAPATVRDNDSNVDTVLTSDEHLLKLAGEKGRLIDSFLELLKSAAVDCPVWQHDNCFLPKLKS